jgi:hypothetical protein
MTRCVVLLLTILVAAPAAAQKQCPVQIYSNAKVEPDYDCPGPGEDALVPRLELKASVELKLKAPAPWEGILLDKNRVLTLGLRIKGLRRIRWQETTACAERLAAELKYAESSSKATLDLRTAQRDNYKKQAEALQKEVISLNKWYRSGPFWFAVGVVTATAGTLAAVLASK